MNYESTRNIKVVDQSGRPQVIVEITTIVESKVHGISQKVIRQPQHYTTLDGRPVHKHTSHTGITYEVIGSPAQIWH